MYWRLIHRHPGDEPSREYIVRAARPGRRPAEARRLPDRPRLDAPIAPAREKPDMNLTHDAMLVSLRIAAWSGRQYDRNASTHVAVHHEASVSAGRYNKCLLPKAAFAALTATMSAARSAHYAQTLPWDDQGSRLLTVANYEGYTELMDGLRERMVRERARFIEDYDDNIDQGPARPRQAVPHRGLSLEGSAPGQVRPALPDHPGAGRRPLHGEARLRRTPTG